MKGDRNRNSHPLKTYTDGHTKSTDTVLTIIHRVRAFFIIRIHYIDTSSSNIKSKKPVIG